MSKRNEGLPPGLLAQAIDLLLLPIRFAVSPLARRAYLSGFLLFVASFFLLFISTVAYILFYYAYVPYAAVSVPVYLQYDYGVLRPGPDGMPSSPALSHPFGTALLDPPLSSNQKYDVEVVVDVPRSPVNMRAGNFMVELAMLVGTGTTSTAAAADGEAGAGAGSVERAARAAVQHTGGQFGARDADAQTELEATVVRARRPALLRYSSAPVDLARKAVALPWYALGWKSERETVAVGMLEDVEFAAPRTRRLRGPAAAPGVPDRVRVTLESRELLEVYAVRVEIRARLRGLRWLMYRYRTASFLVFTGGFFLATMGSAVAIYVGLTVRQIMRENDWDLTGGGGLLRIKEEDDEEDETDVQKDGGRVSGKKDASATGDDDDDDDIDLSDTPRQFPTSYGRAPLVYPGRGRQKDGEAQQAAAGAAAAAAKKIKQEPVDDDEDAAATAADIEDEGDYEDAGAESFRDSGIGTGREERDTASARRRRVSGTGKE